MQFTKRLGLTIIKHKTLLAKINNAANGACLAYQNQICTPNIAKKSQILASLLFHSLDKCVDTVLNLHLTHLLWPIFPIHMYV